jgi:acetylornithine deacetylase/succinyl-diaminopimelate desuccinylase-like protein
VFKLGTRGLVYLHVSVRTGDRALHSGAYGGAALNAADALLTILDSVRHLPEHFRSGTTPPAPDEIPDWTHLPDGRAMLEERGARPRDEQAVARFHQRTLAEPALDIHGIDVGEAHLTATSIPVAAEATLSIRLAPGQDPQEIASACADALVAAAPPGADVTVDVRSAVAPSFTSSTSRVIRIGLEAFERTLGRRPLLTRSGGTVPIRAALSERSIPTIHTGFDVPSGNAHAPDERLYLPYLTAGIAAARETLLGLGALSGHRE